MNPSPTQTGASAIPTELVQALRAAEHVVGLTGAGISAESGVPTFRDAQTGLWATYSPEELATPQAFRRNPRLVWEWYAWRRALVAQAEPNPGHVALAQLAAYLSEPVSPSTPSSPRFTLITQNVDGLHQRAGSQAVIELHGNIHRALCFNEDIGVDTWAQTDEVPPRCPHCGGPLRPAVVWFGELLPQPALQAALAAAERAAVFLSIGTSGLVQPAASLPFVALERGAVVVEINPEATPLTAQATYVLAGPAGQVLRALLKALAG